MQKIILYYLFTPIEGTEAVKFWQRALCERLNLKGRIILAEHGINGTLGGDIKDLKAYIKETKAFSAFKGVQFKWSDGAREDFPRLSVKVRTELVTFGVADEIKVNEQGIVGGGKHLKPEEVHKLVEQRGEAVVFFDGRNAYEAAVGKFKNAVVPPVEHTRDFPAALDDPVLEGIKDRPIVTYCTGGIRCEVLSMLMKRRGFKEVYQIDGGIQKYGEKFGDQGFWEGSLYVFDGRMGHKFSEKADDIGMCEHCGKETSNYENCANKACNKLILICESCVNNQECKDCIAAIR